MKLNHAQTLHDLLNYSSNCWDMTNKPAREKVIWSKDTFGNGLLGKIYQSSVNIGAVNEIDTSNGVCRMSENKVRR